MPGFSQSVTLAASRLTSGEGRSTRSEFWYWNLTLFLAAMVINVIAAFILSYNRAISCSEYGGLFSLLVTIFWPLLCVTVCIRRLHDRNMSGWWFLVLLVPIASLVMLFIIMFLPGTPGPNRFGPDPLGRQPRQQP